MKDMIKRRREWNQAIINSLCSINSRYTGCCTAHDVYCTHLPHTNSLVDEINIKCNRCILEKDMWNNSSRRFLDYVRPKFKQHQQGKGE